MAYIIDKEECIGCGSCEGECPSGAISADDDGKYCISPDLCIDCGVCCETCPTEAIKA